MPSRADATPAFLWIPELGEPGTSFVLGAEEARYLTRVCRARVGERFTVTDGRGATARARLVETGRRTEARVETCEREERDRECWVLCGAPERGRADWMVEKLAELSVARFIPVDCGRARWGAGAGSLARWQRLARAALQQSRGRFLLEVMEPVGLESALERLPPGSTRWEANPGGTPAGAQRPLERGIGVGLIGPGAGLDEREHLRLMDQGFIPIALSDCRLRTETAAIAWAAWWSAWATSPTGSGTHATPPGGAGVGFA